MAQQFVVSTQGSCTKGHSSEEFFSVCYRMDFEWVIERVCDKEPKTIQCVPDDIAVNESVTSVK